MMHQSVTRVAVAAVLLGGVSLIVLATPAHASRVLFSTNAALNGKDLTPDTEVIVDNGITQVDLGNGAVAAFVDGAQFSLRPDGALDLRGGTVTVVSPTGVPVSVMMPDGVVGSIDGENASASFTVTAKGARGSVLGGRVAVLANGVRRTYSRGSFWLAPKGHAPEQAVANAPAAVPGTVRTQRTGGIAAAAVNGIPVALGEALAAVGANGDIVTAARRLEVYDRNPSLTAFPRGDYATLIAYAAGAAAPLGGPAFNGAGADIVRTYFQFLASGRQPGDFRAAYAQSLLGYLDLLRSGALPSGFAGATQAQLSAYIAFIGRTDGFGALSATNRTLLDAYLAFLSGGGTPDGFGLRASTLVGSYLDYLRAGGDPAKFAAASASVVAQYLAILQSGGIKNQLTPANRALLDAYLASLAKTGNGLAFSNSAATGLAAFTAYLNGGGFPSQYSAADAASIRGYLETLSATGLFDRVLGSQALFLRSYLVFLQGGGSADAFDKLPINVLTTQANALGSYYLFIHNGGTPSSYALLTQVQISAYLKALNDVGLFDALLGANARFLADYYAFLQQGGNPDLYAGLPNVDLNAYAAQVATYVAYLRSGKLPSGYTALTAQQLRDYLNALSASGKLATLLGGDATFLASYLAYLQSGGPPDQFTGLPIYTYTAYSTQLTAFIAYLNGGGLPSGYTTLTAAQIRGYLEALQANGQLAALLGANANFFTTYLAYLQGGGSGDAFTGLPIATYTGYGTQLAAFVAYLNGGGLPSGYTTLTAAQIRSYLEVLQANGQLVELLGANADFFTTYLTYLQGGGSADGFTGLPIVTYRSYATALNAFYGYLAGGGRPSGYTVLTATQIKSYLDALNTAGQTNTLLGSYASFFAGYLTYLNGGGNGDQYAGLPGSTTTTPPAPTYTYTGGFPATGGRAFVLIGYPQSFVDQIAQVDSKGVLQQVGYVGRGTSTAVDVAGDANVVIGRWTNGTVFYSDSIAAKANGVPYVVLAPRTGTLPTSGTISYSLLAATRPVYSQEFGLPGVFKGNLSLTFGTTLKYSVDGSIVMPEASGSVTYSFASANGTALAPGLVLPAILTGTGAACASGTCAINFKGDFAGATPADRIGLLYQTYDKANVNAPQIGGAVIFGATTSSAPPPLPAPTPAGAPTGTALRYGQQGTFSKAVDIVADADGKLRGYGALAQRGTATDHENGGLAGVIGWTRWSGGTTQAAGDGSAASQVNGGYGRIWGTPATAVPTAGIAMYDLAGSTAVTSENGRLAPGKIQTANLGVDFGQRKVGFASTFTVGGINYAIETRGGVAAPIMALGVSNEFYSDQPGMGTLVSVGGNGCSPGTCPASLAGFLAGSGASHAGLSFSFYNPDAAAFAGAAIAFGKRP